MPDGSVYSTTDPTGSTPHHHPSLADLEAHYTAAKLPLSYRGWTEDVCGYPVITYKKEQEQFMGGFIDAGQADDIVEQTVARLLERLPAILDSKLRIHPIQAESIVQATTGRTVAQLKNDAIPRGQADDIARAAADYTVEQLAEAGKS
jgi:hypothetical protein